MTATIVWAPIVAPWLDRTLRIIEMLIPASQFQAAMRFRRWQDRQARLLARLALRQILQEQHIDKTLDEIEMNPGGRSFIRGGGDFSITHTDMLAACAWVPRGRVGIDVETTRTSLSIEDMLPWMSDAERRRIAKSPIPLAETLRLWTAKEAVCKADGCGLLVADLPDCATPLVPFRGNVWRVATKQRHAQTVSLASLDAEPAIPRVSRLRLEASHPSEHEAITRSLQRRSK